MHTAPPVRRSTVLLVDPDPDARVAVRAALEAAGLDPLPVGSEGDAMLVARYLRAPLDLVLVDARVGGQPGADLARALIEHRPEARALVVGGPEPEPGWAWIDKPFTSRELVDAIEAVLTGPR